MQQRREAAVAIDRLPRRLATGRRAAIPTRGRRLWRSFSGPLGRHFSCSAFAVGGTVKILARQLRRRLVVFVF